MKITPDVNSSGLRPAGNVLTRPSSGGGKTSSSDAKFSQDVIVKMQREKSLIDALAIAQSSRDLVQKALNVSARLMSLASEAMLTGRVNIDEVAGQMSGLNSSMGNYGQSVILPVESTPVPADKIEQKIDQGYAQLKERASEMISGKPVDRKEFETVAVNLNEAASELDVKIKNYSKELGSVGVINDFNFNYTGLNKNTAGMVLTDPQNALAAQGNISNEMAGRLTMA